MNFKKPSFWDLKKPNFLSFLLTPLSLPVIIRNFFFIFFRKKSFSEIKTICLGNIYLGGTGKTPLTIKIYEILKKKGLNIATVKKFHSNQIDEQRLLKQKTSLIISKKRINAVFEGIKRKVDILIFDDGLQDFQINYDKKIVCFKSENWIGNGRIIPAGPLRQGIKSLKYFDAAILNGKSDDIKKIEYEIKKVNNNIEIFRTYYKIHNINNYDVDSNYLIFSGIGNPSDFKNLLKENNFKISKEVIFPDHYTYKEDEIENIINIANKENLKIITTEKDYTKIPSNFKNKINFLEIELIINNENELINLLLN